MFGLGKQTSLKPLGLAFAGALDGQTADVQLIVGRRIPGVIAGMASLGRDAQARPLLEGVLHNARVGTPSSRELNRVSIDQARAALKVVESRGG